MNWSRERGHGFGPQARTRLKPATAPTLRINRLDLRPGLQARLVPKRPVPQKPSGLSTVDRTVVAAGICMAVASASFATYMVSTDHSHPTFPGADHLMLFAQPSRGLSQRLIARVPGARDDSGIDYTATGAIPDNDAAVPQPLYTLPSINVPRDQIIKDFTLRGVSGDVALVDGPGGLFRLERGADLPGGGQVLSIEWRQGQFVVVTTRGVIVETQP